MPGQLNRAIIDTNLLISFLLTKNLSIFDKIITDKQLVLVFSRELVEEFLEVTQRSKFEKYFSNSDTEELLLKLRNKATFIHVTSNINICRDPKDNFLLSLAVDGKATHIVTGDKDLLVLGKIGETKILTITEYLAAA